MRLSILTTHVQKRKFMLEELVACLKPQLITDVVEHLIDDDPVLSVGTKRNRLLSMSKGDYVAFVDDDDLVSDNYVKLILAAIETNPDCVGMRGILNDNGKDQGQFEHSIKYDKWSEQSGTVRWLRCPNHLNPILRQHAIRAGFTDKNVGEDWDYSCAVRPYLKTEVFIDQPIYLYRHHQK
jgi:glycosyltransferase involved in cell wall biosynthesis